MVRREDGLPVAERECNVSSLTNPPPRLLPFPFLVSVTQDAKERINSSRQIHESITHPLSSGETEWVLKGEETRWKRERMKQATWTLTRSNVESVWISWHSILSVHLSSDLLIIQFRLLRLADSSPLSRTRTITSVHPKTEYGLKEISTFLQPTRTGL
jgi:hypothetical protein